ncbi:FHA domain-containing protein [Georgenia sp. AZ-5]|uniref:FHA domain-containing protein n=1 Tax=Georgenia sp. AZ-5 TaxID=3367526 RepID=UPI0037540BDD
MKQTQGTPSLQPSGNPYLDVLSLGSHHGRRLVLAQQALVLGNGEGCDIRFDDPQLSPTHAAVRHEDGVVVVEDLGSALGTFVNGVAVTGTSELHPGDVVTLADVRLRFGTGAAVSDDAEELLVPEPADDADPLAVFEDEPPPVTGAVRPAQYAEQVVRHREGLLAAAAVTRRHGRRLVWVGALVFTLGCAVFLVGVLAYTGVAGVVVDRLGRPPDMLGWNLVGVPSGHVGWAFCVVGLGLVAVGVVLHLVARSRTRRVEREIPAPPPAWQVSG